MTRARPNDRHSADGRRHGLHIPAASGEVEAPAIRTAAFPTTGSSTANLGAMPDR
jgi:hypothetical protein